MAHMDAVIDALNKHWDGLDATGRKRAMAHVVAEATRNVAGHGLALDSYEQRCQRTAKRMNEDMVRAIRKAVRS